MPGVVGLNFGEPPVELPVSPPLNPPHARLKGESERKQHNIKIIKKII